MVNYLDLIQTIIDLILILQTTVMDPYITINCTFIAIIFVGTFSSMQISLGAILLTSSFITYIGTASFGYNHTANFDRNIDFDQTTNFDHTTDFNHNIGFDRNFDFHNYHCSFDSYY